MVQLRREASAIGVKYWKLLRSRVATVLVDCLQFKDEVLKMESEAADMLNTESELETLLKGRASF